ncbi:MAG TPA: hypothetical protein VFV87_19205 [Pirellulaceae bacterium]|nr:hypothetical protein [Pirellulaceae bacterium]
MMRGAFIFLGFVTLAVVAGCGSGYTPPAGVIVTGKVVQGGQPVSTAPTEDGYNGAHVNFFTTDGKGGDATVPCDANGNFRIEYAGEGLPPAHYKVSIAVRNGGPETDMLENKIGRDTTDIEFDIPKEKLGGEFDVGTIEINDHLK